MKYIRKIDAHRSGKMCETNTKHYTNFSYLCQAFNSFRCTLICRRLHQRLLALLFRKQNNVAEKSANESNWVRAIMHILLNGVSCVRESVYIVFNLVTTDLYKQSVRNGYLILICRQVNNLIS